MDVKNGQWKPHSLTVTQNVVPLTLLKFGSYVSPKGLCTKDLEPSLWPYWNMVEPLIRGEASSEEVGSLGPRPWRGYRDPGSSLFGCQVEDSLLRHALLPWCPVLPQGQATHRLEPLKPWVKINLFFELVYVRYFVIITGSWLTQTHTD